ncbi:hypothetical protein NA56DRAFT_702842 [Hyaloscypha hepaticicola]|uniref:Uncharacterized protein n=1 Tax=Hyaloscypha hepaticicola TaxID=2082293 RepID=A0A2J6Q6H9_9HELO|nr:hypothetical protein NA56DRAFT_702842 [Hyaloscypha hepaticicola]
MNTVEMVVNVPASRLTSSFKGQMKHALHHYKARSTSGLEQQCLKTGQLRPQSVAKMFGSRFESRSGASADCHAMEPGLCERERERERERQRECAHRHIILQKAFMPHGMRAFTDRPHFRQKPAPNYGFLGPEHRKNPSTTSRAPPIVKDLPIRAASKSSDP